MPCTHINHMSDEDVKSWLNSFDTVMTDCDGVLWVGAEAIQGSPQVINRFRELGKRVFFVTNNSTKHRREYKQKVDTLGFGGDLDEIIGTAYLAASYLEDCGFDKTKKVYVVGSAGITQELDDVGIQYLPIGVEERMSITTDLNLLGAEDAGLYSKDVNAVIIGFTRSFSLLHIIYATKFLTNPNCLLIADSPDPTFSMRDENNVKHQCPGTGSMVAAVETAAGRKPIILGKPNPLMFEIVQKRHPSVKPERTLMIGDRADTDILLGKNCGLQTLMVGTGVHSLEKVKDWETSTDSEEQRLVPDKFADRLGDLLEYHP
ncbi:glycerol-3-phosphate phosphatase isoform X2 [Eurytemora carolleeae]|uniref:glycerol-3-phosphate phosphatase isoform X2 n=1 Tax=Eurytemora carolleeae TaxID=1294199 RepID=UPI000C785A9E|nr:glycerol-3-phosphate phosphatase isoform X2 [Eurytemora carolleeae]|eukprot:XP_023330010.1 glycerol-3-phosphate phosphatase-like isoform X2 [Eurytemora affinis]